MIMKDLIPVFAGLIFPPTCLFCGKPGHLELDLCESCLDAMPFIGHTCHRCALPLSGSSQPLTCGRCLKTPPHFDDAVSAFEYRDLAQELVTDLKYRARLPVARTLADLLWWTVRGRDIPDALLPVPLHPRRLRERGFNQAVIIADMINRHTECAIWRTEVRRDRDTASQTGLDAGERRKNVRGAFSIRGDIRARHVVIIDDVITTGSTANEIAVLLKRHGVERVSLWSVARAPLDV